MHLCTFSIWVNWFITWEYGMFRSNNLYIFDDVCKVSMEFSFEKLFLKECYSEVIKKLATIMGTLNMTICYLQIFLPVVILYSRDNNSNCREWSVSQFWSFWYTTVLNWTQSDKCINFKEITTTFLACKKIMLLLSKWVNSVFCSKFKNSIYGDSQYIFHSDLLWS